MIPPNKDMSILHGVLHLLEPAAPRGLRLPIDFFFRSLADDRQERSIGVILSGMGSDGTLGLRAIKEKAGVVFVQAPASAKFDGMPRSAIDAGLADVVAPVGGAAAAGSSPISSTRRSIARPDPSLEGKTQSALEKVVSCCGRRPATTSPCTRRAPSTAGSSGAWASTRSTRSPTYVRFLRENPQETELLFKELLIGVTSFFRDPAAWEQLQATRSSRPCWRPAQPAGCCGPGCPAARRGRRPIPWPSSSRRRWSRSSRPGASHSRSLPPTWTGTPSTRRAQGVYPANIAADVSPERLRRFFVQDEHGYRVGKEIREMVVFAPQNVIMDPPFTKLDLLICRNLLIYLAPELQKKLIPLFHYSLNPGGVLFLGSAETIGAFTDLFAPLDGKTRLYRRLDAAPAGGAGRISLLVRPRSAGGLRSLQPQARTPGPNLQSLADQLLLQRFAPAAVLTNDKGDILYISGRTGKYLEPAAGKANWNIFAMAREGLRYELSSGFQKALRQKAPVSLKDVKVGTNGGVQTVDVTVQPISEPEALRGMVMVVFTDVATPPETKAAGQTADALPAAATAWRRWSRSCGRPARSCRPPAKRCRPRRKSSNPPTRSCSPPTRSCRAPTRS